MLSTAQFLPVFLLFFLLCSDREAVSGNECNNFSGEVTAEKKETPGGLISEQISKVHRFISHPLSNF